MIPFYDHLLDIDGLQQELATHLPDDAERAHILGLLDASLHHVVMDVIFTTVPVAMHEVFLVRYNEDPSSDDHLEFLRQFNPTIEEAIRYAAKHSKRQFIDAIHAE